jgi:formylglycine-generating enzyme required for sulfatase activity
VIGLGKTGSGGDNRPWPVGSKTPGGLDMVGNITEWTSSSDLGAESEWRLEARVRSFVIAGRTGCSGPVDARMERDEQAPEEASGQHSGNQRRDQTIGREPRS